MVGRQGECASLGQIVSKTEGLERAPSDQPGTRTRTLAAGSQNAQAKQRFARKRKRPLGFPRGRYLRRQLPTLPQPLRCSTIGPAGLNFRVRDGNGCDPCGIATDFASLAALHPNSPFGLP